MKNDIDSILDSMFQGGKLNLRGAERRTAQAQETLDQVGKAQDALSRSLESSLDALTKETQAELASLEQRLQADGLKNRVPAGNGGDPKELERAFDTAEKETAVAVVGQEELLNGLSIAFRRPFVAGFPEDMPMARVAVLGPKGTGKHSALQSMTAVLARLGVLKNPKTLRLNLSGYKDSAGEKMFYQDFYGALKGGASAILFDYEGGCPPGVLAMVSQIFCTGQLPLPGRYAEQKGMLVEIGQALVPGAVASLSAAGKYLFLVASQPMEKLMDVFGAPFFMALDDICETRPFSEEGKLALAGLALQGLVQRAQQKLGFSLTCDGEATAVLAGSYREDLGAPSLFQKTEELFRALSERKLRKGLPAEGGVVSPLENTLTVLGKDGVSLAERPKATANEEAVKKVKEELFAIVGLKPVKEYILALEDDFKVQQLRREKGLKSASPAMHMIFTGNPGTGKTTVARIVSRYLKAIGLLKGGQLLEVTRADLVGKYVGHTAPLTQKAINAALGGVLFIDEAYSLYRGKDDTFGMECIDTLVKGMEDHRDNLVVILAGYSREMEEFLTANSGLSSRFPNKIEFPDYTAAELLEITQSIVKGKGYRLDPACEAPLLAFYEKSQRENSRGGGNGRLARNKVEEAIIACSRRVMKHLEENSDLELLLPEDFDLSAAAEEPQAKN